MKRRNLIFLISILVLGLFFGVFTFLEKGKDNNRNEKSTISSWKVYKSEKYGFTFKVPRAWEVKSGDDYKHGLIVVEDQDGNEKLAMSVAQNGQDQELFKGLCYGYDSKICEESDQGVIDFQAGKGFVYLAPRAPGERRFIILANKRLTFSINNNINESRRVVKMINRIIDSIKVDPGWKKLDDFEAIESLVDGKFVFNDLDSEGWKVYQDKEIGLEFKIPENWKCVTSFSKEEAEYNFFSKGIKCANEKDTNYLDAKDLTDSEVVEESYCERIAFLISPSFTRSLGFGFSFAPSDYRKNYNRLKNLKSLESKEKLSVKVFQVRDHGGYIVMEGGTRTAFFNWQNYSFITVYSQNECNDKSSFDNILKSFGSVN